MSVAGIDVGDSASCIALARKGGKKSFWSSDDCQLDISIDVPMHPTCFFRPCLCAGVDVLLNKESNRETPSVVTFTTKQRMMGTSAGE